MTQLAQAQQPTDYNRANPSPRYRELLTMYQTMHRDGDPRYQIAPEQMFAGISLAANLPLIKNYLPRLPAANTMLDYGCGKAFAYQQRNVMIPNVPGVYESVEAYLGTKATLYDPAYPPYMELPKGTFDFVISTDVLEHCPEADIPWILREMFSYANHFVFANVASYPAKKTLPNGENAHCTIQPPAWWKERIREASATKPEVKFSFMLAFKSPTGEMSFSEYRNFN